MSWLQLHGETWPVTDDEADLRFHLRAADTGLPRVTWNLEVSHYIRAKNPEAKPGIERWLDIDLGTVTWHDGDWRRLANLEIRAATAWYARQEYFDENGHLMLPQLTVHQTVLHPRTEHDEVEGKRQSWMAHDFILRFGNRDGWSFPCELDAWLIPEADYHRTTPETLEQTKHFPQTPPDLRLITRATFTQGSVELTRAAAADPITHARNILREQTRCDTLRQPKLDWMLRQTPGREKIVPMPGWRSTVHFHTTPDNNQPEQNK